MSLLGSVKKEQFELLCRDGTRRPVDDYRTCHWGTVPSRAIVTSSATNFEIRRKYQKFLEKAVRILHKDRNDTTGFNRFANSQGDLDNRPGYNNRFGESDYNRGGGFGESDYNRGGGFGDSDNRGGFRNPNEYSTDNWDRNGYDRSFGGGGGRGGTEGGLNSWEKPAINDTFDYYNREREHNFEPTNVQPIEVFDLYESAPRYGMQHNLIFSVNLNIFVVRLFAIELLLIRISFF